jgi:hypothetical protein
VNRTNAQTPSILHRIQVLELPMDPKQPANAGRWLNRNVIGLAVNRFLSDFGHEAGTSSSVSRGDRRARHGARPD